jgi:hypothetical protein
MNLERSKIPYYTVFSKFNSVVLHGVVRNEPKNVSGVQSEVVT